MPTHSAGPNSSIEVKASSVVDSSSDSIKVLSAFSRVRGSCAGGSSWCFFVVENDRYELPGSHGAAPDGLTARERTGRSSVRCCGGRGGGGGGATSRGRGVGSIDCEPALLLRHDGYRRMRVVWN